MNIKKITNIIVAIFAMTVFFIATAPKLFADSSILTTSGSYAPADITYQLNIPCAIDRTKIILPVKSHLNSDGPYKTICNSSAYFNEETEIYHLKKNEGYYLDLVILPEKTSKKINFSEIETITIDFYNQDNEKTCFTKKLIKDPTEENLYVGKISYVKGNDSKEFALENMEGFINSCGMDTTLKFEVTVESKTGEKFTAKNSGNIKFLVIDSDNSNIVAENARAQKQAQVQVRKMQSNSENKNIQQRESINAINKAQISKQLTIRNNNEFYMVRENKVKKIMPVTQMLQENKINVAKVIGDINLETVSETPTYVFEVKEQRKLFGFIPIGHKITKKRISAIKEITE
jgi:hypothetical protein